jgi:hypothetical protein
VNAKSAPTNVSVSGIVTLGRAPSDVSNDSTPDPPGPLGVPVDHAGAVTEIVPDWPAAIDSPAGVAEKPPLAVAFEIVSAADALSFLIVTVWAALAPIHGVEKSSALAETSVTAEGDKAPVKSISFGEIPHVVPRIVIGAEDVPPFTAMNVTPVLVFVGVIRV